MLKRFLKRWSLLGLLVIALGICSLTYFGSFGWFVIRGHRDYWTLSNHAFRYLPDDANQCDEALLSRVFYPAYKVTRLVGFDIEYLHEPMYGIPNDNQ